MENYYAVEIDETDEFGNGPPVQWCVSQYEDDPADAICWINQDIELHRQEEIANIIAKALTAESTKGGAK